MEISTLSRLLELSTATAWIFRLPLGPLTLLNVARKVFPLTLIASTLSPVLSKNPSPSMSNSAKTLSNDLSSLAVISIIKLLPISILAPGDGELIAIIGSVKSNGPCKRSMSYLLCSGSAWKRDWVF